VVPVSKIDKAAALVVLGYPTPAQIVLGSMLLVACLIFFHDDPVLSQ